MKKTNLLISMMLLSIICLSSCLGDGNTKTSGNTVGVLEMSSVSLTWVMKTASDFGYVSSPQLSQLISEGKMQPDGCYLFNYEIDFGLPENASSVVQNTGYYVVNITEFNEITKAPVSSYLTDTAKVLNNEAIVQNGYYADGIIFAGEYLFIQHVVSQPADAVLNWEMSYDYNSIGNPTVEGGVRYYDLFLRATVRVEGTKSNVNMAYLNAYRLSGFLRSAAQSEKYFLGGSTSSSSVFRVRVYYATDIKDGVITWQYANLGIPIYAFAADE